MIKKTISITLIFLIIIPSFIIANDEPEYYPFSKEEIKEISNKLKEHERTDSIKTSIINDYKYVVSEYKQLRKLDSLKITYKDSLINLARKRCEKKWYENNHIWFFFGIATTVLSGWAIGQVAR